jgi:nucleoside-triphosphatase
MIIYLEMMRTIKNILLTGKPGAGKTTALQSTIDKIGVPAGGFYTLEMRMGKERSGFEIVTLSGDKRAMASKGFESPYKVGSYGIDIEAIDVLAAGAILDAIGNSSVIVIDEIGRMELYSEKFRSAVLRALDSDKPVIGTIMEKNNAFADAIKDRIDVDLVRITGENRDTIPDLLKIKIEGLLHPH